MNFFDQTDDTETVAPPVVQGRSFEMSQASKDWITSERRPEERESLLMQVAEAESKRLGVYTISVPFGMVQYRIRDPVRFERLGERCPDMNRLTKRRELLIGGCVLVAVVPGVACTGITPAQAATIDVAFMGSSDQSLVGSSDMTWVVSNGNLGSVPPLGIGQEVLSGGYQDGYILTGPSQYESSQVLNNSDIVPFDTMSQVQSTGPGLYEESMMLHSAGAAASGVTCGVDSLDAEGANFTATPYCETVVVHSLFMAEDLVYRSVGSISQADLEMPDTFAFAVIGSGSGFGSMSFGSRSLAGIGTTTELGYVNAIGKDLIVSSRFNIGEDVRWTSFAKTFDVVG